MSSSPPFGEPNPFDPPWDLEEDFMDVVKQAARDNLALLKFNLQDPHNLGAASIPEFLIEDYEATYRAMGGDPDEVGPDLVLAWNGSLYERVDPSKARFDAAANHWVVVS